MIGIATIDMPNSCFSCPFVKTIERDDTLKDYCVLMRQITLVDDYVMKRHENCPLFDLNDRQTRPRGRW